MTYRDQHCCEDMCRAIRDDDLPVVYVPKFREYGVRILDGGSSYRLLHYCPWCGTTFPSSLRDKWFAKIDELGLEPDSTGVPESMRSDKWWKEELGV